MTKTDQPAEIINTAQSSSAHRELWKWNNSSGRKKEGSKCSLTCPLSLMTSSLMPTSGAWRACSGSRSGRSLCRTRCKRMAVGKEKMTLDFAFSQHQKSENFSHFSVIFVSGKLFGFYTMVNPKENIIVKTSACIWVKSWECRQIESDSLHIRQPFFRS